MFFERIFYVYSPGSCLPTLPTLSTAEGFPIKQIEPRNPSCSRWTGTGHIPGRGSLAPHPRPGQHGLSKGIQPVSTLSIGVTPLISVSIVDELSQSARRRPPWEVQQKPPVCSLRQRPNFTSIYILTVLKCPISVHCENFANVR